MKFIFKAFSHKIRSFLITKQALVQSLTRISVERGRIPASKPPYFEREVFWDNNSQTFWDQLPSPRILVLCGDEINAIFEYTEWNEKNKF